MGFKITWSTWDLSKDEFWILYLKQKESKLFKWFDSLLKPGKGLPIFKGSEKQTNEDYFGFTYD